MLTQTKVTVGSATTSILGEKKAHGRNHIYIYNNSDEIMWFKFNDSAVIGEGYPLPVGAFFNWSERDILPEFNGQLNGICASGSKSVSVVEGIK